MQDVSTLTQLRSAERPERDQVALKSKSSYLISNRTAETRKSEVGCLGLRLDLPVAVCIVNVTPGHDGVVVVDKTLKFLGQTKEPRD